MSNLQAFFAQNVDQTITIKQVISTRFKDEEGNPIPFEFQAISREREKEIRKSCTKKERDRKRGMKTIIDEDSFIDKFVAACTVFPNLKDSDLQKSYGVMGEVDLLKAMLLPGEFTEALLVAQEVNGYDKDMNDLVEEAKN
ncbi:phage portal protein [Vallitalea longa]|uniref:Phage portal protein n=1 Tax=Vallitalea longa TaxID=2936439 RepID=A0A9W6DF85_9FIRM|nr:phage portal protein [Vallitalea longa]GKX29193.1 phage portal protein [Vallitalea longa]